MKTIHHLLTLAASLLIATQASANFLPEYQLLQENTLEEKSNITETDFNQVINRLQVLYAPAVKSFGGKLKIQGQWKSRTLNAGAKQQFGQWKVFITGAIARQPTLTKDGFTLILCHELGHHLAGFPIRPAMSPLEGKWGATEGQADYYSTHACAKKIWGDEAEINASFQQQVEPYAQVACNSVWPAQRDRDLCYRTQVAVNSMITTMATLMKKSVPHFETPDQSIVEETYMGHPAVQCRMDTAFQGALCTKPFNDSIIPGKKAQGGAFSLKAEEESSQVSCTRSQNYEIGLRPACWFKARL